MTDIIYCTCDEPFWRQTVTREIWCTRCGSPHGFEEPPPPDDDDTPARRGKRK